MLIKVIASVAEVYLILCVYLPEALEIRPKRDRFVLVGFLCVARHNQGLLVEVMGYLSIGPSPTFESSQSVLFFRVGK